MDLPSYFLREASASLSFFHKMIIKINIKINIKED